MLELDALSAPISDEQPAGEDLSFSDEFDTILDARRADDPTLDQGDWVTDIKQADWPKALELSTELLQRRTKDLRVGGWFAEANAQINGFPGLAMGYRLIAQLCDRYWDDLHPQTSGGDQEERIGALDWLLVNSEQWLRMLPIAQSADGKKSFGLAVFEAARFRGAGGDSNDNSPTMADLGTIRGDTPREFYAQLCEAIPDCQAALSELEKAVDARLGVDGPSFSGVREQFKSLYETVQRFAREAGVLVDGQNTETTDDSTMTDAGTSPVQHRGPIKSRRQALTQLREVAEYFRNTEPHSPVAYLADKAARWGEMPLHVWLKQVIKDDNVRGQLEEMLDLENPKSILDS